MKNTNKADWKLIELEHVPINELRKRESTYICLKDPYCLNAENNYIDWAKYGM